MPIWAIVSIALIVILACFFTVLGIVDPDAIPGRRDPDRDGGGSPAAPKR